MGGSDARPAMLPWLVGGGELSHHLGLDFPLVEGVAMVHAHHAAPHLGQDDHVLQVCLHHLELLHGRSLLLGLAQALQLRVLLPLQTPVQLLLPPPPGTYSCIGCS